MADIDDFPRYYNPRISTTYGIPENYGESFLKMDYRIPTSQFGFPSDPRSANQLQAVSQKISTGTKTIEVSGVNITGGGPMRLMDTIPKQQFKEIERLKKLTGVDLTFHGPLVEPTGFSRQGWTESERENSERQMISSIERSHELDPKGNLVVTFHSSNGLPEPETWIKDEKGKEKLSSFLVIDETEGRFGNIVPKMSHLTGEVDVNNINDYLKKENEKNWYEALDSMNFNIRRGVEPLIRLKKDKEGKALLDLFGKVGTEEGEKLLNILEKEGIDKEAIKENLNELTFVDLNLRRAYQQFQEIYDKAYTSALRTKDEQERQQSLRKLDEFKKDIQPKLGYIKDPSKIDVLAEELQKGIQVLRTVTPEILRPVREWAIDKASTTFANVALSSFKKYKNSAPIISIENPPVGMGLTKADDLRELVDEARNKFIEQAVDEFGMSKSEAKLKAEQLIGVTWDVGHINMLRGHGYTEKDIIEQTKKIAPYVKHVHLSDNFGLEHTELPMGMGNVPTKQMLNLIDKYNKQAKKIVETGDWFQPFRTTPFRETLNTFGSSVFEGGPYWNQAAYLSGGYFSGQGATNPPIHHSLYGSGFSNLPVDFGGQMAGRSRVSGAPIE